jgi:hypothetical protein
MLSATAGTDKRPVPVPAVARVVSYQPDSCDAFLTGLSRFAPESAIWRATGYKPKYAISNPVQEVETGLLDAM